MSREKTLGVLGGGQLGRMFVQAAQRLGFDTLVLAPEAQVDGALSPAAQVSQHVVVADYADANALAALTQRCFAVTTEFENVPASVLAELAKPERKLAVTPQAGAVQIAQNRILEKQHFQSCGVPVVPYLVIELPQQLDCVQPDFYPAILKTARMGYDGKGQITVHNNAELRTAWDKLSRTSCVLEQRLALVRECSVLLARQVDAAGAERLIHWPVQHNVHVDGILASTAVEALPALDDQSLVAAAQTIARDLNYVGVLCVEFFILDGGAWAVNEIAPRPHNSGHVTMDASSLSQFEAQVRVAAGLPLVQPRQHSSAVMLNVLGQAWAGGEPPPWGKIVALGSSTVGVHVHLYGKEEARAGRKMGHINITAATLADAWQTATLIQQLLH